MSAALPEVPLPEGARIVADLHLEPGVRGPWEAFLAFLRGCEGVPALFVLGDLFEFWIGRGQTRDPEYAPLHLTRATMAELWFEPNTVNARWRDEARKSYEQFLKLAPNAPERAVVEKRLQALK